MIKAIVNIVIQDTDCLSTITILHMPVMIAGGVLPPITINTQTVQIVFITTMVMILLMAAMLVLTIIWMEVLAKEIAEQEELDSLLTMKEDLLLPQPAMTAITTASSAQAQTQTSVSPAKTGNTFREQQTEENTSLTAPAWTKTSGSSGTRLNLTTQATAGKTEHIRLLSS